MQDISFRQSLTRRYIFALCIVATVFIATYSILNHQINLNKSDAQIINVSGMQRMLSQRIALMARETHHALNDQEVQLYAEKMSVALQKMQSNHEQLISGKFKNNHSQSISPEISALYFGENKLDERVKAYLAKAESFLSLLNAEGVAATRKSNLVKDITTIARNGLLNDLNQAVSLYEKEALSRVQRFKVIETVFLIFGLIVLILEALFLFRPMVKHIADTTQQLKTTNHELIEFSYRISHDLRAPVSSTQGLIKICMQALKQKDYDGLEKPMQFIEKSMASLQTTINDVINVTRTKTTDIKNESFDMEGLVDQSIAKLAGMEFASNIDIITDIKIDGPIRAKRLLMRQILENLISNAIKYQNPDVQNPFVKITVEQSPRGYSLSVEDNGLGIPEKYQHKVFGMFQRLHTGVSSGTGLGLYLVKENVEMMGGKITFQSSKSGTIFTIHLPAQKNKDTS